MAVYKSYKRVLHPLIAKPHVPESHIFIEMSGYQLITGIPNVNCVL